MQLLLHRATDLQNILTDRRSKLVEIHSLTETSPASNTWQEERFNLKVTLPTASTENLRLYLGCSKCGHRTNATIDTIPILKVDAVDDSGSMALTFFAKEVEYLLGIPCTEMWKLKENEKTNTILKLQGNDEAFAEKMFAIRQKIVTIEIGPTLALITSRVFNWT
ncbi:Replication factor A protein 1, partial [Bienertia sinuspersici]